MDRRLQLRRAKPQDMDLLYRWANDDTVRAKKMMADASVCQYILYDGDLAVGQIRLTAGNDGEALIDYSIASLYRGKGYGTSLLCLLCQKLDTDKISNVTKLIGQVKYQNQASARVFEKSGFHKTKLPEYIQYEKERSR